MEHNLLLIALPCETAMKDFIEDTYDYNPSLGLLAINSYLSMFDIDCYIIDYNYEELNYDKLETFIKENGISVVGVSSYTETQEAMFSFMKFIKSINPAIVTVTGGAQATLNVNDVIKNRAVDFVITKDGEAPFLELMIYLEYGEKQLQKDDIAGLYYKEKRTLLGKPGNNILDLDLLPVINRELVDINRYSKTITIYSSKGCPGQCIYCAASFISGARIRMRDEDIIFLECQLIDKQIPYEEGPLEIFFSDDTFTVNPKRVRRFCEMCQKYDINMVWSCESRVDVMTIELVDLLAISKCYSIQFGVESGNQEVLNKIRKHINLGHLEKIISHAKQYPIEIFTSFILGHYCDTDETMIQTITFAKHLKKLNPNVNYVVSINTPFPGTYQYDHPDEIGIEIIDRDYSHYNLMTPVFRTKNFGPEKLLELQKLANQ